MSWNAVNRYLSQRVHFIDFLLPGKTTASTTISYPFLKKDTKTCNKPRDA